MFLVNNGLSKYYGISLLYNDRGILPLLKQRNFLKKSDFLNFQ